MDTPAFPLIPIALDNLRVSGLNVRTGEGRSLEELAASIVAEGLLQNLTVTRAEDGAYEVVAGKLRLGALRLLRERGQLPGGLEAPPCRVVDNERATSASLAENIVRQAMHPADEFLAFQRLVDAGRSIEEIAQEFGVIPLLVQRRLKLANVAPSLFELFRQDRIALDQMMALALTDDHALQEAAWNVPEIWRQAHQIRARLTKEEFNIARDAAARYVGAEALSAAGVIIRQDLFSDRGDGYTSDRLMVDQLALDKLERAAEALREEGWSWVECRVAFNDWNLPELGFSRITVGSDERNLPAAERERLQTLQSELDELRESSEDYDDDAAERDDALEAEIEALRERARAFTPEQRAAAGAIVTIAANGTLEVHRGLVRKGSAKADTTRGGASDRLADAGGSAAPAKKAAKTDLSAPLVQRLQAQRTAIVQLAMLDAPHAAMAVLVNALLATVAPGGAMRGPCRIRHEGPGDLRQAADELPLMRHFITLQERKSALLDTLPKPSERFDWLLAQSPETLDELLTLAVALSIDTSDAAHGGSRAEKAAMESLVAALGIDFAAHWSATKETFLGHVPRAVIEQAVREARDAKEVEKLAGKKKPELVEAAEHLLADTGWLPKPLRMSKPKAPPPAAAAPAKQKPTPAKPAAKGKAKPATKPAPKPKAKPVVKKKAKRAKAKP